MARSVRECAGAGGRAVALELDRDAVGVNELLAFAGVVRWMRGRALAGRAVIVALEGELGGRVVLDEGPILGKRKRRVGGGQGVSSRPQA